MAGAGVIHCEQDVTRTDCEFLAAYGGEFENTGQRDDVPMTCADTRFYQRCDIR